MVKPKGKENLELTHVDKTPAMRAIDTKLVPLRKRHDELKSKVDHWRGLRNPHVDEPGTEDEYLEAKIELPSAEQELARLQWESGKLERERKRIRPIEENRITDMADLERLEAGEEFLAALVSTLTAHKKLRDAEQLYERLGLHPIVDSWVWPELDEPEPTHTPRIHSLRESVQQERGRREGPGVHV